jgi:hypothetical protein
MRDDCLPKAPRVVNMTSSTYFEETQAQPPAHDAHQQLLASLTRINTYNPPVQTCSTGWKFHGLYYGPTSVAYLFFRLSQLYTNLEFKGQGLLDWATAYLDVGAIGQGDGVDANHCGIGNEVLAQLALRTVINKDEGLARKLCSHEKIINVERGSDEWLYGRAGYLYFLRIAATAFETSSKVNLLIKTTIQMTCQRILASQQPWTWHGKAYLGAAHGAFGILAQVMLSDPSWANNVETIIDNLLDTQLPSGNFPSSLPAGSDRLVQFCHGGPGVVLSLRSLRPHFPKLRTKIDAAIRVAQNDIQTRGLLTKTPCLCHGIAGNVLALDVDQQISHFLAHMTSDAMEGTTWLGKAGRDDQFVGLFTGEAGRAWVWAVQDIGVSERPCIGFNDL